MQNKVVGVVAMATYALFTAVTTTEAVKFIVKLIVD
jgi:predicted ribosomally synthesized peptide with SipW-like signal peptide